MCVVRACIRAAIEAPFEGCMRQVGLHKSPQLSIPHVGNSDSDHGDVHVLLLEIKSFGGSLVAGTSNSGCFDTLCR